MNETTNISLFSLYTALILWWISAALWPSACKKRITARILHLTAPFFDVGIQKLVSSYDMCLSSEGDYVKK
jgi:hypothetical protein